VGRAWPWAGGGGPRGRGQGTGAGAGAGMGGGRRARRAQGARARAPRRCSDLCYALPWPPIGLSSRQSATPWRALREKPPPDTAAVARTPGGAYLCANGPLPSIGPPVGGGGTAPRPRRPFAPRGCAHGRGRGPAPPRDPRCAPNARPGANPGCRRRRGTGTGAAAARPCVRRGSVGAPRAPGPKAPRRLQTETTPARTWRPKNAQPPPANTPTAPDRNTPTPAARGSGCVGGRGLCPRARIRAAPAPVGGERAATARGPRSRRGRRNTRAARPRGRFGRARAGHPVWRARGAGSRGAPAAGRRRGAEGFRRGARATPARAPPAARRGGRRRQGVKIDANLCPTPRRPPPATALCRPQRRPAQSNINQAPFLARTNP
jgi:hypothetical protein